MLLRIEFIDGPATGLTSSIDPRGSIIIGRGPTANVMVQNHGVSRAHCQIRSEKGRCVIQDLGSTNGTFVNDQRVTECELRPSDEVRIGNSRFRLVEYEDEMLGHTTHIVPDR